MKKLYKSISQISIFLFAIALTFSSFAKAPRGVVTAVKGNVFVTSKGQTKTLDVGDYLYDFDNLFSEVGAQLSFNDYYDHTYHISGSAHVAILNQMIELKNGYLWVQSIEKSNTRYFIQTVNSNLSYTEGEFIISYDTDIGKTQLLSIKGTHLFKNSVQEYLKEEISAGMFSYISESYENGAPRVPTPVGSSAYVTVLSLFDDVRPMLKRDETIEQIKRFPARELESRTVGRKIASVPKKNSSADGSIIVIRRKKNRTSERSDSLMSFYKNKVRGMSKNFKRAKKRFKPDFTSHSAVKVKVFGQGKTRKPASSDAIKRLVRKSVRTTRKPASMRELNPQVKLKKNSFESSLLKEYKKQMRHSKEINSLIQELNSYDQDYSESY